MSEIVRIFFPHSFRVPSRFLLLFLLQRDWFVPSADTTRHGIHRHVEWMDSTIKFFDPQLHAHLV
jgi:hypothetical protein